jgi:hypothetical protein
MRAEHVPRGPSHELSPKPTRESVEEWNALGNGRELGPKKLRYTHDAMVDLLIANPGISQGELAAAFGYTQTWVSLILSSDSFRIRLEDRRTELVDPTIRSTIEERFRALAVKSLEVLQKKLENPNVSDNLAIQAASLASKSLGLGGHAAAAPPPDPGRLDRIGGRLLALLGDRVSQHDAERTLDAEITDATPRSPAT